MKKLHWLWVIVFISGCTTLGIIELDKRYGESHHSNRPLASDTSAEAATHFNQTVKPIIESRCVVCHGCFDAPCQLKLETNVGLNRGASKVKVYDGARLKTINPTSFVNNQTDIGYWREQGFFPVLNERQQTPQANLDSSLFYQMLALKQAHPLPETELLDSSFDLALDRNQQCPTIEEFEQYKSRTPLAGMPYGLPGLSNEEHSILEKWIEEGAQTTNAYTLTDDETKMVEKWEVFLNGSSLKQQVVSRYIYEHLYLANLYFDKNSRRFFKIVRSTTAPNIPVKPIVTRRPFDSPGNEKFYYRIVFNNDTIIAKRHMPYRFDSEKLSRYKTLFFEPDYKVTKLPSYNIETASNPFKTFAELPIKSRYLFLLEESQFTIMNFIKGPVCRGQIALNVINDHFWVYFKNPDNIELFHLDEFLATQTDHLQLPAATSDGVLSLFDWRKYANEQKVYLKAEQDFIDKIDAKQTVLNLDLIWQGNGNPNAALTIFRHFDSATVLKGTIGQQPKTAWVIGYPLMERIHYLLVAGFDVYADVSHQLKTRLYMDFLRQEGESNFVTLLPKDVRQSTFESWYIGVNNAFSGYTYSDSNDRLPESDLTYNTSDPKSELLAQLNAYVKGSVTLGDAIPTTDKFYESFIPLYQFKGEQVSRFPQTSIIKVNDKNNKAHYYTLINNSSHSNVAHLFAEDKRRMPSGDSVTLTKGITGTYPNAFFEVNEQDVKNFVSLLVTVSSEQDYKTLKDRYAIRRTNPKFWQFADNLHEWYRLNKPLEYGLLDFNRLENR